MNDTSESKKPSWWRRLSSGLKRTSSSIGTALAEFVSKRKLDRAMLEEIEDVLLRADLGIEVSARIAAAVGDGRYDKMISRQTRSRRSSPPRSRRCWPRWRSRW